MAPTGSDLETDWIYSPNSNAHVSTHPEWFTNLREFDSFVVGGAEVQGVGDVQLSVMTGIIPEQRSYGKLILRNVLFIPQHPCNIIGSPIIDDYDLESAQQKRSFCIKDSKTADVRGRFFVTRAGLFKLLLKKQLKNTSSLNLREHYDLKVKWPTAERNRWEVQKSYASSPVRIDSLSPRSRARSRASETSAPTTSATSTASSMPSEPLPYTADEKAWIKSNWGSEYYLLRAFDLSIEHDEDRIEGRQIVRGIISQQNSNDEEQDWY